MNFLAHCALASDAAGTWACSDSERDGLLAGAVIGDFIKGRISEEWPDALIGGTRLHRKVDAWSNVNANVKQLSRLYPDTLRRYAPIFIDLVADYHLARNWDRLYPMQLTHFTPVCYDAIGRYHAFLPHHGQRFVSYMTGEDLLASYANLNALDRGLHSVLRRLDKLDLYSAAHAATLTVIDESETATLALLADLRESLTGWNAFDQVQSAR